MFDPDADYVKVFEYDTGPYYVSPIEDVFEDIKKTISEDFTWDYKIESIPITEDEYNALPEFDGF